MSVWSVCLTDWTVPVWMERLCLYNLSNSERSISISVPFSVCLYIPMFHPHVRLSVRPLVSSRWQGRYRMHLETMAARRMCLSVCLSAWPSNSILCRCPHVICMSGHCPSVCPYGCPRVFFLLEVFVSTMCVQLPLSELLPPGPPDSRQC